MSWYERTGRSGMGQTPQTIIGLTTTQTPAVPVAAPATDASTYLIYGAVGLAAYLLYRHFSKQKSATVVLPPPEET